MWEEATRGPGGGSRALPGSCHCCAFGGRDEGRPSERGHLFSSKPNKSAPSWLPPSWPPLSIIKKFPFGRERPEQPKQTGLFVAHKTLSRAEFRDGPDFGYSFCVSRLWLETLHKILPYIDGRSLFNCILAVYKIRHVGWVYRAAFRRQRPASRPILPHRLGETGKSRLVASFWSTP
jgi:hypothetical protein